MRSNVINIVKIDLDYTFEFCYAFTTVYLVFVTCNLTLLFVQIVEI